VSGVAIVVFSDLVDSTALLARLGDDRMEVVRRAHVEDVEQAVGAAGGRVVKTLGDGVMASFESALGALRAAAAIQAAVEHLDRRHGEIGIAARIGVAAGEPISDGDDLHGMTVVIASRLSSAAGSGEVLVQGLVRELIASRDGLGIEKARDYELKGVPLPVSAATLDWRSLVAAGPAEDATARADELLAPKGRPAIRLPPALAAYADEPLIGRDREIAALREATSPQPGRRAALVVGEPGIGKTRHAAAAAAEVHAEGATVVLARCPPEAVVAFEPWVRAIGELALAGDDAWRSALADAAGAELAALVPELSEHATLADRAAIDQVVAAEGARYRLFRGIGAVLSHAAGESPLYVVLDDAHWCDPASAQALEHLLDGGLSQLSLVVTARRREMGRRHPIYKVLSGLRRTGDLTELPLTGLDASGLADLVGARLGRAITPQLAARLQARTSGNPFFAGELARDLDGQGELGDEGTLEDAPVPSAVAGLVEGRLARLDPEAERLLQAAAIIGPAAPVGLAAKAAGLDASQAERAVAGALAGRLVDEVVAPQPTVAFPHALIREALIAGTSEAAKARLHLAIAEALRQDRTAEPAELARHYGLAAGLAGPEPALAAYRAAGRTAAKAHDHEQAATHMKSALSLLPVEAIEDRAAALLELGEQEMLCADMNRARGSFRAAAEAAREIGDAVALAHAALGFSGGDIGFGWETSVLDVASAELLRESLAALGQDEPKLALRVIFRLAYLLVITDDEEEMAALARRAEDLGSRLGDAEARVLAGFTRLVASYAHSPDPLHALDDLDEFFDVLVSAEECGREDLLFRVLQWIAVVHYVYGRTDECDRAIERAGEIARRLGSPRFSWEVDFNRGMRMLDHGDRVEGEKLIRRAGAVVRRLRPDIHIGVEATGLLISEWAFDGETSSNRLVWEAWDNAVPRGVSSAAVAFVAAVEGDFDVAHRRMWALLEGGIRSMRRPDAYVPMTIWALAYAATNLGDREAGERLRPMLEPLRGRVVGLMPLLGFGHLPEWHIGRLELLAGRPGAAIEELREAVARADALGIAWARSLGRIDLAVALHRDREPARAAATLAEAEEIAERYGIGWADRGLAEAHAELEGREPEKAAVSRARSRQVRALAARGGRQALATMVKGLDDAALERRFVDPRRQRALVKALARGFQPAAADGFKGVIAYELEPYAIEPPPDSPWRWAIEVDAGAGRARLLEPAPLDAALTVHIGLAEWVRVLAGLEDALSAMVTGRSSVEGDVLLAIRQEAMFGG